MWVAILPGGRTQVFQILTDKRRGGNDPCKLDFQLRSSKAITKIESLIQGSDSAGKAPPLLTEGKSLARRKKLMTNKDSIFRRKGKDGCNH